jgi:hypothetical protein
VARDTLFLLDPRFRDEKGAQQICPDCVLIEGVLAAFPDLCSDIEVRHVACPPPRQERGALGRVKNSACPLMVRQSNGGAVVIDDFEQILTVLSRDYKVPAEITTQS